VSLTLGWRMPFRSPEIERPLHTNNFPRFLQQPGQASGHDHDTDQHVAEYGRHPKLGRP
jgi:hypothetical protein